MRKFGLIGYPLGHSFSKSYFTEKFQKENLNDHAYENHELSDINQFLNLIITSPELVGLNVTAPYKQQVIGFLDEIDTEADEIGAVNTIKITRSAKGVSLKGFNTDVYGFRKPLEEVLQEENTKALILGTGGASKAVAWVLKKLNVPFQYVSRSRGREGVISYEDVSSDIVKSHKLIVNTSPVGTSPNIDQAPKLDYSSITKNHILYDLVYNPEETLFLQRGKEKKAITINGLPMLYFQADKAWEIWNS